MNDILIFNKFQQDLDDLKTFEEFLNMDKIVQRIHNSTKSMYPSVLIPNKSKKKRRFNPLKDLDENEFCFSYRFTKENMKRLVELLKDDLEIEMASGKERKNQVPVENQIMLALRYWGATEHPDVTASAHGVNKGTLLKISKRVAEALSYKASRYIRMPCLLAEKEKVAKEFFNLAHMPQVIGAVAHTKVKCKRMQLETINSKDIINIQIVSDGSLKIRDIDCRVVDPSLSPWEIFCQSRIKERFEQNEFRGRLLLGDYSFQCCSYLYTPIICPMTQAQQSFNNSLRFTYDPVRRCLSLLRQRFGIMDSFVVSSSVSTAQVRNICVALALLHNMAVEWNDPTLDATSCVDHSSKPMQNRDTRGREEFIKNNFCTQNV